MLGSNWAAHFRYLILKYSPPLYELALAGARYLLLLGMPPGWFSHARLPAGPFRL
jgi:hypothetical protein